MYLPEIAAGKVVLAGLGAQGSRELIEGYEWFDSVVAGIESFLLQIWALLCHWASAILAACKEFIHDPPAWTMDAFVAVYRFLREHPHVILTLSLAVFLGPIIILIPFLLLQEIGVLVTFNLGFVGHGLIPGRVEDQYEALKEQCMESKEKVFASVEEATAIFNEWTTEYPALMFTRVLCGILGLYVLYRQFTGWTLI